MGYFWSYIFIAILEQSLKHMYNQFVMIGFGLMLIRPKLYISENIHFVILGHKFYKVHLDDEVRQL